MAGLDAPLHALRLGTAGLAALLVGFPEGIAGLAALLAGFPDLPSMFILRLTDLRFCAGIARTQSCLDA